MNSKALIVIVIVIIITAGAVIFLPRPDENGSGGADSEGDELFSMTFIDYDGNEVSLADFQGKPLVVNSWAVWCPFCRKELPDFAAAQEEFGEQVVIVAIDRAESLETQKQYTDELGLTDDLVFWQDPDDEFYRAIGGFSMPETLFLDAEGNTVLHKRGFMNLEEMRGNIEKIL